jgi:simple sugar transport system permease protein
MGLIYSFLTVTLKANQNVTGLAMTTFGVGTTKFIMSGMATQAMKYLYALDYFRFPFAESTTSLKYCGIMMYLAIAIALVASYVLTRTRVGLHLRAVGENPATADAVGINVTGYKYVATCIGSGVAALGGLFYIMDYSGSYEAYKSIEALGWLAIALVIFTLWRPHISIIGSILFGALYLAGSHIPTLLGIQLDMSATPLLQMLPYAVTIIVLIVTSVRKNRESQPPASLGLSYFREER